ncbi:hypothetical protein LTR36_007157 [Oleoguttula mirabilis]|uniref:Zinc finger PHD-type domain-containing protein n=1 Tax=Oleoguttula mirabilis TaxID=1507867 RepID=A0AAV9JA00_9PEZI|nr:hypothetical protein LTR36_007157 [Oleoguttula mirabilis]
MTTSQSTTALEAGAIINEYYTIEDYVRRRATYLGKHPKYRDFAYLFPIARRDAGGVFAFEREKLSVQEVRRREQAAGFIVLLPLPTKGNTQTVDDFNSYGDREWSPSVSWPVARPAISYEAQDNLTTTSSITATSANTHNVLMSHAAVQAPSSSQQPALNVAHSSSSNTQTVTPPVSPTIAASQYSHGAPAQVAQDPRSSVQTTMTPSANTNSNVASHEQTVTGTSPAPSKGLHSDQLLVEVSADSTSTMADPASTVPTTSTMGCQLYDARQQELIRFVIANLGKQPGEQQAPRSTPSVTALSSTEQQAPPFASSVNSDQPSEHAAPPSTASDSYGQPSQQQAPLSASSSSGDQLVDQHGPPSTASVTDRQPTQQQAPPSTASVSGDQLIDQYAPPSTPPIIGNQPTEQQPPPSSSSVRVGKDVAALAGRGMSVPVKHKSSKKNTASASPSAHATGGIVVKELIDEQMSEAGPDVVEQKGGKKRAASEATETEAPPAVSDRGSTEQTPDAASPPAKRLKALKGPRKPTASPSPKPASAPKSKTEKKAASSRINRLDSVVAGTALPEDAREAKQAANARYKALLAQQQLPQKATTSRASRARKNQDPDLLPEFFNPDAFPQGPMHDQQVRCLCGAVTDDGEPMIGCDKCLVWEHRQCIGAGLPADPDEDAYLCRMCDPWMHRVVIARLRGEHSLE